MRKVVASRGCGVLAAVLAAMALSSCRAPAEVKAEADASPAPDVKAWGEGGTLASALAKCERSGDAKDFDAFVERADRLLALRDDRRGLKDDFRNAVMPDWGSSHYTYGKRYCWIVHSGVLTSPMARWAYVVRRDPKLRASYGAKADEYVEAVLETVDAHETEWREGPGEGEGHYVFLKAGQLPLNQQNALGRTIVALWLATGDTRHRTRAVKMARYFKRCLRKWDDAYVWTYWATSTRGAEDIGHASINVDFAFQCFRAGMVFDKADMEAFAENYRKISRADGRSTDNVDGSNDKGSKGYRAVAGWRHLTEIDFDRFRFEAPVTRKAASTPWVLRFSDDFERAELGDAWRAMSGTWRIEDGELRAGVRGRGKEALIMCTRKFPGSQRLEFDARSDDPNPCDLGGLIAANDMGIMSGYYFGFGSEWNTYSRLLVQGPPAVESDAVITPGKTHHIVCQREGRTITLEVDGKVILTYVHEIPLEGPDHETVGFHIYSTGSIDNVKVYTKDGAGGQ